MAKQEDAPWMTPKEHEWYYKNGQLKAKGIYMGAIQAGPYETYYENGQLKSKGTYNMGERRSALSANRSDWNICAAREGFGTMPARALAG